MTIFKKNRNCLCSTFYSTFLTCRLLGMFPFKWYHIKSEKNLCSFKLSNFWLVYSILILLFEIWYRWLYFDFNANNPCQQYYFYLINKWLCVIINGSGLILLYKSNNQFTGMLRKLAYCYTFICPVNQNCCWFAGTVSVVCYLAIWTVAIVLGGLMLTFLNIQDSYYHGSVMQVLIYSRCYIWIIASVEIIFSVVVAKKNCLITVLKMCFSYEQSHPRITVEDCTVLTKRTVVGLTVVNCTEPHQHLDSLPVIISSLDKRKLLEYLRLEYKSTNDCCNDFLDLIRNSAVIMATLNVFECFSDLTFIALFWDQSKTVSENILTRIDRVFVVGSKSYATFFLCYVGTMVYWQVSVFRIFIPLPFLDLLVRSTIK